MCNMSNIAEIKFRVRYGETDQMGVVYHGNYAQYFEMGRTDWLREMGLSYRLMEESGIILPVISININYKKSARYDDLITVKTKLVKLPTAKIDFEYEILNVNDEILTTGNTTLVFVNKYTNRPTKCPDYILDKLQN